MAKGDGLAKKSPASWTPAKEEIFIDAYTKEITDCASAKGLTTASWSKVVLAFNKKANLDSQQLQNKLKDLKEKYNELKKLSGDSFDATRGRVSVMNDEWWEARKATKSNNEVSEPIRHIL
jgi:hypothetical protein